MIYPYDTTYIFSNLFFYDENVGFAHKSAVTPRDNDYNWHPDYIVSPPGALMKTYDGGVTWTQISYPVGNLYFVNEDTILGKHYNNLMCSCDGGHTWNSLLNGEDIHSFTILDDHRTIYAVHGAGSYGNINDVIPKIRVYKSVDFGKWWETVYPQNAMPDLSENAPKVPYEISYSYFWEDGKGIVEGHNKLLTRNDFETYDMKSAFNYDYQLSKYAYLRSGYRVILASEDVIREWHTLNLSRSYGWNSKNYSLCDENSNELGVLYREHCDVSACEEDTTFFVITNVDGQYPYLFRITPNEFDGLGPLGVQDHHNNVTVEVSPNPATDNFKVACGNPIRQVMVFDILGKEIFRSKCDHETEIAIDAASWPCGTYVVRVLTDGGSGEAKVVKK